MTVPIYYQDEATRDRLVMGVKDKEFSRTLQMKADLTLKMAVDLAKQQEAALAQIQQQRQTAADSVDAVNRSYSRARGGHRSRWGEGGGGARHRDSNGGHCGKPGSHHASSRGHHHYA